MKIKVINIFLVASFAFALIMQSCIIVKKKDLPSEEKFGNINLSPKPIVPMSEEYIRSKKGDMLAFLPKDWFLIDVEEKASSDIFAVAVNPDYTMMAVFTNIKLSELKQDVLDKEGLLGLARISFERHSKKSGGAVKLAGNYNIVNAGLQNFVSYEFSTGTSNINPKTAVFLSSINECYEFSLIPMNIKTGIFPVKTDFDNIFISILSAIQY